MTKKEFENFVKNAMKGLSVTEQEQFLQKITNNWIPEISIKLQKRIKKSYLRCSKCSVYSLKRRFKTIQNKVTEMHVCVHTDAGYGDDDEFADIDYLITYKVCPLCKELTETKQEVIAVKNRRGRGE